MALTVLDASVVIAFLDSSDRHHDDAGAAMDAHGRSELVLPASVYAEVLERDLTNYSGSMTS